jgi:VWFA-related protein
VDATVTDSKGNPVPDLKAGDFKVLLDGKPQELKFCTFVRANDPPAAAAAPAAAVDPMTAPANQPAMPPPEIKRDDVHRTMVLFVADLLTSSESIAGIRAGLKKFVLEQVHPGDLVAIVRSSAGLGALQDFTTDKGMLLAAIDQVKYSNNAMGTAGSSAYAQIGQPGLQGIGPLDLAQLDTIDLTERAAMQTTATLLRVLKSMTGLPGRKSVIIVSDGLRLTGPDEINPMSGDSDTGTGAFLGPIYRSMLGVVDESVRAGVVLYAIDTRGLSSLRAGAADRLKPADPLPGRTVAPTAPNGIDPFAMTSSRRDEYKDNQWGGIFLTAQTGGFMITEANRIDAALERVMADQKGYYLLGFQPSPEAMRPDTTGTPDYHKLKITVNRPGLTVRSHSGFYGIGDHEGTAPSGPELQLSTSLDSQFQESDIHLNVESTYLTGKNNYYIRATVYIDGKDVVFNGPPIHRTGVLHLTTQAFDVKGTLISGGIDQIRRVDLDEEGYRRALQYGLIYTTSLPVPKPGPYQIRVACMDEANSKVGTSGDLVNIPEPKGSGWRLSGIVFQHDLGTDDHIVPAAKSSVYSAGQVAKFEVQLASNGPKAKTEHLELRTRLYRDGVEVWKSTAMPVPPDTSKMPSTFVTGSLEVPKNLTAGHYLVRVEVADRDAPDTASAWQWAKLRIQ